MSDFTKVAINLSIRSFTAFSRFLLIVILAFYLTKSELGEFGLFSSILYFSVFLVSGNIQLFSNRELSASNESEFSFLLSNHISASLILYVINLPLIAFVFYFDFLSLQWLLVFYLLLIIVHVALECQFLLNAMLKQKEASISNLIQNGLWVYALMLFMHFFDAFRSIEMVFLFWFLGAFLSILYFLYQIKDTVSINLKENFSKTWLFHCLKASIILFAAFLFFKMLLVSDRILLEKYGQPDSLGVYVFYVGIVFGVFNLIELGVYSFYTPLLINKYNKDINAYKKTFTEVAIIATCVGALISFVFFMFGELLIKIVVDESYAEEMNSFYILVICGLLHSLQLLFNHALYSRRKDAYLLIINFLSVLLFFFTFYSLPSENMILAVSTSLLASFLFLFLVKIGLYYVVNLTYKCGPRGFI